MNIVAAILWANKGGTFEVRRRPVLGALALVHVLAVLDAVATHAGLCRHYHHTCSQVRTTSR